MGSQIVLTMAQQQPFRIGLTKLREVLNDPWQLEDLADRGLRHIVVIADQLNGGEYRNLFGTPGFLDWADGSDPGIDSNRSFFNSFQEFKSEEQRALALRVLRVLRDTLNNKEYYEELVKIGPCALSLGWDENPSIVEEEGPILVTNFIPGCGPNYDYTIDMDGETYFHG